MKITSKAETVTTYYYKCIYNNDYSTKDYIITNATIEYLIENKLKLKDIYKEIYKHKTPNIKGQDLSDSLWDNSLIKKGAFYLHKELRLTSKAPVFDFMNNKVINFPYYCEMKIKYTAEDVVDYFYSKLNSLNLEMIDRKTDIKTVHNLIKRYSNIDYVEPLDVILCSIDNRIKQRDDVTKLIDVTNDNIEVIKQLQQDMTEIRFKELKQIVWRWENNV